jgi:FkbM family methyltransferase
MPRTPTADEYLATRRVARVVSALALWRRKAVLEGLLRWRFGDLVEAQGHIVEVDPRDRAVGARLRRRGVWSEAETAVIRREVRPGMTVLDVGANIGYFSLLFARLVGASGRVFAFEPEPHNFDLLCRNIARNGYANIHAVAKAISRRAGVQRLYKNPDNLGDHRLGHGAGGREFVDVPVVGLDDLVDEIGGRVHFIKMDIQGGEAAAIEGGEHLLAASSPLAMICEFWPAGIRALGDDPLEHLRRLRRLGFAISILATKPGRLHPLGSDNDLQALCARDQEVNLFCRKA